MSTSAETKAQSWPGSTGQLSSGAGTAVTISPSSALSGSTLTIGGWQTTYEVNFTSLTPVASYSAGAATIDGKTWLFNGIGTASLSAADGLKLTAPAGAQYKVIAQSPTIISLGATPFLSDMLVWTRLESTLATSGSGTDSLVSNWLKNGATTSYSSYIADNKLTWSSNVPTGGASGTCTYQYFYVNSTLAPSQYAANYANDATVLTHDVRVMRLVAADTMEVWTGTWASGWPNLSSMKYRGVARIGGQITSPVAYPSPNDLSYGLCVETLGSMSSDTVAKLKALRIQVK